MTAALISLTNTPPQIMILSEMLELGKKTAAAHAALVPRINKLAPRLVIAIGSAMHDILDELDPAIDYYAAADITSAIFHLNQSLCSGDLIFIKGSNGSGASRVRDAICAVITSNATQKTFRGANYVA